MSESKNGIFSSPENFHAHLESLNKNPSEENSIKESNNESFEQSSTIQVEESPSEKAMEEPVDDMDKESSNKDEELPKNNHLIPKSRFNKEIQKRRTLEEQLNNEREEKIKIQTQLQILSQLQEQVNARNIQSEQPIEEVDPLDPETHKFYTKKLHDLESKLENISQKTTQETQALQYYNIVSAQEQNFERQNPDFKEALEHLTNVEMQVASYFYPQDRVNKYVQQKLQNTLIVALDTGKNAAEIIYNMAKSYGYTPKSTQSKPTSTPNLEAINNNMKKTASIQSLGNSVGMGENSNIYDIKHLLRDPKNPMSGIDPDKFQATLKRVSR